MQLALHAVEGQKVCGGWGTAFEFIQMEHFEAVAGSWIVAGPLCGAHCCAQGQTSDPSHAIDAYFHTKLPVYFDVSTIVELMGEFIAPM